MRSPKPRKARDQTKQVVDEDGEEEEEAFMMEDEDDEFLQTTTKKAKTNGKKKKKKKEEEDAFVVEDASKTRKNGKTTEKDELQKMLVRAERVELEEAFTNVWAAGYLTLEELQEVGKLKPAPQKLARGTAAASARLSSSGTMGLMEPLDGETLQQIFQYAGTRDRFALSEVCPGLLTLRKQPRSWEHVDLRELKGATAKGLLKIARLMDTSRTETLYLCRRAASGYTSKSKDPITANDWIKVINTLKCKDTLETLYLESKRFADGAKTLAALEPHVRRLKSLEFPDVKHTDNLVKLLRQAPKLTSLVVEGNLNVVQLGLRVAQLATAHRGDGARSLLTTLRNKCWWTFTSSTVSDQIFDGLATELPELQVLQAPKVVVYGDVAPPAKPCFQRLHTLVLSEVTFPESRYDLFIFGGRTANLVPSSTAVARLFQSLGQCPSLEACSIKRDVEYLSQKELLAGARHQPAPTLPKLGGVALRSLRVLALFSFAYDANSFAGLDAPRLAHLELVRHSSHKLIGDDFPRDRAAFEQVVHTAAGPGNDVRVVYSDVNPTFDWLCSTLKQLS